LLLDRRCCVKPNALVMRTINKLLKLDIKDALDTLRTNGTKGYYLRALLQVATTGTDADWVVKVIDV
jgi:hypothetical protein